jgi:hypothetical protein
MTFYQGVPGRNDAHSIDESDRISAQELSPEKFAELVPQTFRFC